MAIVKADTLDSHYWGEGIEVKKKFYICKILGLEFEFTNYLVFNAPSIIRETTLVHAIFSDYLENTVFHTSLYLWPCDQIF